MRKVTISALLLGQILCSVFAADVAVNKITALKHPAWLQQGMDKTELDNNQELKPGDQISTGNGGQVEMQIGSASSLLLYPDSEISLPPRQITKSMTDGHPLILVINKGKSCIHSKQVSDSIDYLDIEVGAALVSVASLNYDICVQHEGSLSTVTLRSGSVQVDHGQQGVFVLSEPGIQLRINDNGSFDLIASDSKDSAIKTVGKQKKTKTKNMSSSRPVTTPKVEPQITQDEQTVKEINTTPVVKTPGNYYNVYLFSTLCVFC